jgi:lysophospholipid acyltransferase (LPLAT)-like uncharacterized protein
MKIGDILRQIFYFFCDLWLSSCRAEVINFEPTRCLLENKQNVILTLWHSDIIYSLFFHRKHPSAIMVSPSLDGEWAVGYLKKHGHIPFRGSRMKGGLNALRQIIETIDNKKIHAGIVADGSKGPARKAQKGAVILARETGSPIITSSFYAQNFFRLKSWDRTIIPMPFSKIIMIYGDPIYVPKDIKGAEIDFYKKKMEDTLNNNKKIAEEFFRKNKNYF